MKGVDKAHIPVLHHVIKKHHASDCCYMKDVDFTPTYLGWLGAHKERNRYREIERARQR